MAWNKNALIRYKSIDRCLQNTSKRWTLDALIESCTEALIEYEGRDMQISRRTIQLDIQTMRSGKLGYVAPIEVYRKKYYRYSDRTFTITDIPIDHADMDVLFDSIEMLKQFKKFSLFQELSGVVEKLEDRIFHETGKRNAVIHLDKNESLKGLEHLDLLYRAISEKIPAQITYQSFRAKKPRTYLLYGFILKEFNNRWFVVGRAKGLRKIYTLALDRILSIEVVPSEPFLEEPFDADDYYKDTYGVTVLTDYQIIDLVLKVDHTNAPYVLTKPIHPSQKLVEEYPDGSVVVTLRVHHNFEIERLILGYGDSMEVLGPQLIKDRIVKKLKNALRNYQG